MFDREVVRMFQELSKSSFPYTQVDSQINYYNIFLCVACIRQLEPDCMIPSVLYHHQTLVANLDENFNRIILNCFNAFLRELFILEMNSAKVNGGKLPYFVWQSEVSKELLPQSALLASVTNLEVACKLLVLVSFTCFQYVADFLKLCHLLEDSAAVQEHLG
jgi:hypothetical protein